jgi:hypothetical protein
MKILTLSLAAFISLVTVAKADTVYVSRFSSEGLSGWERKRFKGETDYRLAQEGDSTVVRAHSSAAASGLVRKLRLDSLHHRWLQWRWKIAEPLKNRAEKTKAGDDYSARVYVIFPEFFFWQMKAITYVWAAHLPREESFPNPYTSNAMTVVVESGQDKAGTWVSEQRDILADYHRLFGGEPRKIGAIAIMTDTDNTGGVATAWYGDITLSSTPYPAP